MRKTSSHKGDEDVWATDYKGDMFEVETTEEPVMAEWWIQLGKKECTISIKVFAWFKNSVNNTKVINY